MPMKGPKPVDRYYQQCRKRYPNKAKAYCARTAWNIYCSYKNPNHPGCTEYGKDWRRGPGGKSKPKTELPLAASDKFARLASMISESTRRLNAA